MQNLKRQSIAALSYVDPIVALLISAVILQEQMTFVQMLGGALLLGATFVSENKSIKFSKRLMKKQLNSIQNSGKHSFPTVLYF
jgi:drug/metabolite transporter (DMT)-like permease